MEFTKHTDYENYQIKIEHYYDNDVIYITNKITKETISINHDQAEVLLAALNDIID